MKKVIVVNGASSSGRTSLVTRFTELNNHKYHLVSIDKYLKHLPEGMWERCGNSDHGWAEIGMAFNKHLATLCQTYDKLIVDSFYLLPVAHEHLFTTLGRENVFYVQIYCNLEELERRELLRGNRRRGLARSQFNKVYSFTDYDCKIDSSRFSPDQCALRLIREVSNRL